MFDTLVYYGIPIGLAFSVGLLLAVVLVRLLGRSRGAQSIAPRPAEDEDEDDIGGSFTCYFCYVSYEYGAYECICYGCNRYICLVCTDYEEGRSPCGPHIATDHPAIRLKIKDIED